MQLLLSPEIAHDALVKIPDAISGATLFIPVCLWLQRMRFHRQFR